MSRGNTARVQIRDLVRAVPFRPFAIVMENGDRVIIVHPENIAFDPRENGREDFYVLSEQLRLFSNFGAVTGVALLDVGEPAT